MFFTFYPVFCAASAKPCSPPKPISSPFLCQVPVGSPNPWLEKHLQPGSKSKACAIETGYGGPSAGMKLHGPDAVAAGPGGNPHVQQHKVR